MQYTEAQINQFKDEIIQINITYDDWFLHKYPKINFKEPRENEFLKHGFSRRLQILKHCFNSIFSIYPPEREKILSDKERLDLEIYIQAFILHIFGCIDNLVLIVNIEENIGLPFGQVSLYNKEIQKKLSDKFKKYINEEDKNKPNLFKNWYEDHCKGFRHSLVHRIPLYVPPFGVKDEKRYSEIEQEKWNAIWVKDFNEIDKLNKERASLEHIIPFFTHSFEENSPIMILHAQIIVDFKTIIELSDKFFDEFNVSSNTAFENIKRGFVSHKNELIITGLIFFSGIIISSTLMYYAEGHVNPNAFGSIPRAFWWSVITFTSVGYGDVYPITVIGKIIASFTAIMGVGLHGLLVGIIGAAFMSVLNPKDNQRPSESEILTNYDKQEVRL